MFSCYSHTNSSPPLTSRLRSASIVLGSALLLSACSTQSLQDNTKTQSAKPSAEMVAKALNLSGHLEGGFYRRTYQADDYATLSTEKGERFILTSIFYMLTRESPIGHFHLNKSDIVHYYHIGDPIRYTLIYPDGKLEQVIMGSDVSKGELLQLTVKGGIWKSSELLPGDYGYGLISEAVAPGFDYADMILGTNVLLKDKFPQHWHIMEPLIQEQAIKHPTTR
ncbi:cupin domain-containing protein [Cellvibrio mixtus]|nr:cupin domain-containing protein [Cellvibrio mixtus]